MLEMFIQDRSLVDVECGQNAAVLLLSKNWHDLSFGPAFKILEMSHQDYQFS